MAVSETSTRVAVAAVGVPVAVGVVYLGGWFLAALLAAIAALGAGEAYRMSGHKGARPLRSLGAAAAGGMILVGATDPQAGLSNPGFGWLITALLLIASASAIWARGVEGGPLLAVSTTMFGALYAGLLLVHGLFLRHLPGVVDPVHGTVLVFLPVLLTWSSDTFAYFVGRAFGRRKLIPRVSPGKTVEGSLGALLGTLCVALLYVPLLARFPGYQVSLGEAAFLGLLISVAAQVGDLAESLLKRDAGVKDSGTLLPGHGGALDRFDSLFFTLPVAYAFLRYVAGAG